FPYTTLFRSRISKLIVLRTGDTPSLLWELGLVVKEIGPEKLVLLVTNATDYESFKKLATPILPKPLPSYQTPKRYWMYATEPASSVKGLIYFSKDWHPHFVPLLAPRWRTGKPLARALIYAMRPVY